MIGNGSASFGAPERAALHAGAGKVAGLLIGALGDRDALHADIEPGVVHHREHVFEPAVFLADAPADRVPIGEHAGRRGVDAELVFEAEGADIVARASAALLVGQKFRHQEQRDAVTAGRRGGGARQHSVDDVRRQVVVAIGDEDLLSGDPVMTAPFPRAGTARVVSAPRSEPACGSVKFIVPAHSPRTSRPR